MDLIEKIKKWLEDEVYDGAEVVEAKNNDEEEITSDGTDDIIYGRAECAEGLLNQIKKWESER